jgi:hypothetical protein
MGASSCDHNTLDRIAAGYAWLAGALIDAMLQLKEAAHAVGIDVVGERRTAALDRSLQNFTERAP